MATLCRRLARASLIAATLVLGACGAMAGRNGDNSIAQVPDRAVEGNEPAVPPPAEPPIGSATHP